MHLSLLLKPTFCKQQLFYNYAVQTYHVWNGTTTTNVINYKRCGVEGMHYDITALYGAGNLQHMKHLT